MNIEEATAVATAALADAGIGNPRREASSLLAFVLGRERTFLIAHPDHVLTGDEDARFREVTDRRASREPLQYITGRQEFWGLDFAVTPDVLVPRPETEILVEEAIRLLTPLDSPRFAEAGAGSGCIAVSILHSVPNASAIATDISAAALAVALQNAQRQGVADRLALVEASVLDGVSGPLDLVVSNPPYIPDAQIEALDPEVRDHEPRLALSGGDDGLAVIMQVIAGSRSLLRSGGSLLMEIGFDQSEQVRGLLTTDDWAGVAFLHDLQGIPRIVKAIRN